MIQSSNFLENKVQQVHQILQTANEFNAYSSEMLTWRIAPHSWNILECLEHLNLYGNYYLPQIESQIAKSKSTFDEHFKNGLLGKYFSESMLPKDKLNKMKTFKDKNPLHSNLNNEVIATFNQQQLQLLELLGRAKNISLNKVKIETSISRFIRLKLGDTFEFYINHIFRHLKQIENIQTEFKKHNLTAL